MSYKVNYKEQRPLRHLRNSMRYTLAGLRAAWRNEAAFRQEILLTLLMVPAALWLGQTLIERLLLIGVCLLVLCIELMNAAVEAVVDRIGSEYHELSGRAKDLGSAAVFLSLVLAGTVWLAIGAQRFLGL